MRTAAGGSASVDGKIGLLQEQPAVTGATVPGATTTQQAGERFAFGRSHRPGQAQRKRATQHHITHVLRVAQPPEYDALDIVRSIGGFCLTPTPEQSGGTGGEPVGKFEDLRNLDAPFVREVSGLPQAGGDAIQQHHRRAGALDHKSVALPLADELAAANLLAQVLVLQRGRHQAEDDIVDASPVLILVLPAEADLVRSDHVPSVRPPADASGHSQTVGAERRLRG